MTFDPVQPPGGCRRLIITMNYKRRTRAPVLNITGTRVLRCPLHIFNSCFECFSLTEGKSPSDRGAAHVAFAPFGMSFSAAADTVYQRIIL